MFLAFDPVTTFNCPASFAVPRWAEEVLQNDVQVQNPVAAAAFSNSPFDALLLDEVPWMGGSAPGAAGAAATVGATAAAPTAAENDSTSRPSAEAVAADWTQEFESANPELTRTANQLFGTVDNPKFSNAEFLKFVNSFGGGGGNSGGSGGDGGEVKINEKNNQRVEFTTSSSSSSPSPSPALTAGTRQRESIADRWAAELEAESRNLAEGNRRRRSWEEEEEEAELSRDASTTSKKTPKDRDESVAATTTASDFMEKLQLEWEAAGARVGGADSGSGSSDWFQTFSGAGRGRDAFAVYNFDADNPYLNLIGADEMEEGRRRLRRGDLANAVLFFEAAVQKGE